MEPNKPTTDFGLADFQQAPAEAGLSLDQLNAAFAEMLGSGDDPYAPAAETNDGEANDPLVEAVAQLSPEGATEADDPCEISPRSILEALLFVGGPTGTILKSEQIASLMRGVRPIEIDELVQELNATYTAANCPYHIVSVGDGYRLALRDEWQRLRDKFQGKVRQTQLSPAAIEVLSIVAYNEPVTADQVSKLRSSPSGPILANLVSKQLLTSEKITGQRGTQFRTTRRFLELFNLKSLSDLPRSTDLGEISEASEK